MTLAGTRGLSFALVAGLPLALGACPHRLAARLEIGAPLRLETRDEAGRERLVTGAGRPRLVVIWASWCGLCPEALQEATRIAEHFGLELVTVAVDTDRHKALEAAAAMQVPRPWLWDGAARASTLAGIRRVPTFLLIDARGRVVALFEGIDPGPMARLERAAGRLEEEP